jgi:hypothetical protein
MSGCPSTPSFDYDGPSNLYLLLQSTAVLTLAGQLAMTADDAEDMVLD